MKHFWKTVCALLIVISMMLSMSVSVGFAAGFKQMQKGSTGDDVKLLQQALIGQGYLSGTADGDFGDMTKSAVSNFQLANGLTVTGIADEKTVTLLYSKEAERKENSVLQKGDNNEDVASVKQRLIELGYLFGRASSKFDDEMEAAVKAFQNRNNLVITGKVNKEVRTALYSATVVKASYASVVIPESIQIVNHYGTPYIRVTVKNNGSETVDAVNFHFKAYNTYGERCSVYGGVWMYDAESSYHVFQFNNRIFPGSIATTNRNQEESLYSYQSNDSGTITTVKMAVYRFHTEDGRTYEIPENEWIWYDNNGNSEMLQKKHGLAAQKATEELQDIANKLGVGLGERDVKTLKDYMADIYGLPYGGLLLDSNPGKGIIKDAGIVYRDVITKVDDYAIYTLNDLIYALGESAKDGNIEIVYFHNAERNSFSTDTSGKVPVTVPVVEEETSETAVPEADSGTKEEPEPSESSPAQPVDPSEEQAGKEELLPFAVGKSIPINVNRYGEEKHLVFQLDGAHAVNFGFPAEEGRQLITVQGVLENIDYSSSNTNQIYGKEFGEDILIVEDQDGFALEFFDVVGPKDGQYEVCGNVKQGTKKRISLPYFAEENTESIFVSVS